VAYGAQDCYCVSGSWGSHNRRRTYARYMSAIHLERSSRASRPKNFTEEPVSNADEFDRYCEVVSECEKIAHSSSSSDVKAEAKSMIPKMRGLLKPELRDEVDFNEAAKDCSNVFAHWLNNEPAGTRAFIPSKEDRDKCYAALQIYSCALEESQLIPSEYQDMFGDEDGYWIYRTMLDNIGELCLGKNKNN